MVMRRGKRVPVPPGLAAELAPLAALCGGADLGAVIKAAAALDGRKRGNTIKQAGMCVGLAAIRSHLQPPGFPRQHGVEVHLATRPCLHTLPLPAGADWRHRL